MRTDYIFIKRILNTMQDMESYVAEVRLLAEEVKSSIDGQDEDVYLNKFFGHLQLLKDNNAIEVLKGDGVGAVYNFNLKGYVSISGSLIRMTSKGYDLLNMLNKKGILEKLKDVTISGAIFASKEFATKTIENIVNKII